ncbi:MAG: Cyanate transport protein cynX [Solirubrobacterales bacterium]|nr:Cyanate transport protein cynX [Solirubrobacterales bacterium]
MHAGPAAPPRKASTAAAPVGGVLVMAALVLAALNLRPALASVGPVLPAIRSDLGLSGAQAGLLTTIPALCFAAFAPAAPRLATRFGLERTLVWCLALTGLATALRATVGGTAALFATTLAAGVAIAVTQTLLPSMVKRRFASRALLATGAYALSINLGALLAASLSAPASDAFGGSWKGALAIWAVFAPAAVVVWIMLGRSAPARAVPVAGEVPGGLPWRSAKAWALTLYMGGLSIIYIVTLTWLAPLYHDHGYSSGRAGAVLSVFAGAQIVSGLTIPPLAHRHSSHGFWLSTSIAAVGLGVLAVATVPLTAPWLWAAIAGLGMGGAFPLVLTLFVDHATSAEHAGQLTAMAFCGGYLVAAAGPTGAGAISDLTGSLTVPFVILAAVALAMVIVTPRLAGQQGEPAT